MVNMCLLSLHDPCRSVWHGTRRREMGFPRGKWELQLSAGGWWSRIAESGVAAVILGFSSLSSTAHPLFQWCSGSWAELSPFHLWLLWSCPLPRAVWAVCLGTPQCVMILICSSQSQGGCLQTGRLFCQGLHFNAFYFGGLNRKYLTVCGCWVKHCGVTNVGTLPSGYLLSHRQCWIFYLEEHGPLY